MYMYVLFHSCYFIFLSFVMSSIEANHEPIDIARKGSEVCIKIDSTSSDKLNQDHTHNLCTSFVAL